MGMRWASGVVLLLGVGCVTAPDPTADNPPAVAVPSPATEAARKAVGFEVTTYDETLARLGRRFPGFAGVEVDERRGRLLIYTSSKLGDVDALHSKLVSIFGEDKGRLEPKVIMRRYSFRQLKQWYDPLSMRVLSFDGVTMSDINETTNTIDVGVSDVSRYAAAVRAVARRQGIPPGVVRVIHQEPIGFD